jgi:hypothetical protein
MGVVVEASRAAYRPRMDYGFSNVMDDDARVVMDK